MVTWPEFNLHKFFNLENPIPVEAATGRLDVTQEWKTANSYNREILERRGMHLDMIRRLLQNDSTTPHTITGDALNPNDSALVDCIAAVKGR